MTRSSCYDGLGLKLVCNFHDQAILLQRFSVKISVRLSVNLVYKPVFAFHDQAILLWQISVRSPSPGLSGMTV